VRGDDPVQYLKGVGPRRAELLEKAGIRTVDDLLYHLPFRYEDRRQIVPIRAARAGDEVTVVGTVSGVREIRIRRRGGRPMLEAVLSEAGYQIWLVWFHQAAYFHKKLDSARTWLVHGRVEASRRGGLQIIHPEIEAVADGDDEPAKLARIVPVYSKPTDLPLSAMRTLVERAVEALVAQATSVVPRSVGERLGLLGISEALRYVHAPPPDADIAALQGSASAAHRTLILEELFALQVGMTLRRAQREAESGIAMPAATERVERFLSSLPFRPTGAQRRVIAEISADMARPVPMNRLVHGDVGSGKTVVAFAAALQAIEAGYQVAVMAPTELLAEQHAATMEPWARSQGVRLELLTGNLAAGEARRAREAVEQGQVDLVVGTHALVQETTVFARLGLAVIDEQHRFGVMQRATLRGGSADTLLLSATPIPRTLSLTLYGDLDVSFLDEMPPGRKPVVTRVVRQSRREHLYERMARALAEGRQCYVVYPLVEESEKMDLADATSQAERLQAGPFRDFRVGLLHGRMRAEEKDAVMRRFKAGDLHVLVATTVIEVGIDVPNASIMVIEHAERFGLAQLHQLRGRVGRGTEEAFCCLVADESQSVEAMERLRVMEQTTDGFAIAEADLKLRGPGEYLGTRQSGLPAFRAANLVRDAELLELARAEATAWLRHDPALAAPESQPLKDAIERRWGDRLRLAEVG
jgi:ATP-dependent DNA helicase RecG